MILRNLTVRAAQIRDKSLPVIALSVLVSGSAWGEPLSTYTQRNLVATSAQYQPQIIDPGIANAWGIAIRPAGLGGHFWVTANGNNTSNQFVGDVAGKPLSTDSLAYVQVAGPANQIGGGTPTGVVFNNSRQFQVTQSPSLGANLSAISAPAKFLFATDNGVISAWTERASAASPDGFDWPLYSSAVIDRSGVGSQFFGLGLSRTGLLYAADFGTAPALRVWNGLYQEQASFKYPFANGNGATPGDWVPFNVQVLESQNKESVWVTYARSQADPNRSTQILAGEEFAGRGEGRIAEFSLSGELLRTCSGDGLLNAPWGLAIAPVGFGQASGQLLVSNFGDGTMVRFDLGTCEAKDYLRNESSDPIAIEGIWGLQFGNGASLGEANRLYFAAGPEDEKAGLFGYLALNSSSVPLPGSLMLLGLGAFVMLGRQFQQRLARHE